MGQDAVFDARRVAPLVAGLVAVLLILLVLPSPLRVPFEHPRESAEYAPVPGAVREPTPNFARAPVSPGIGAPGWALAPGAAPGIVPTVELFQFAPRQKDCFGQPPRQTADPMSPPCVPFFKGDNGGATYQGVTRDRIEVVLYSDHLDHEVDLTLPYDPAADEAPPDRANPPWSTNLVRTMKAHLRYFQKHYQTYGRQVHVVALPDTSASSGSTDQQCMARKKDALQTVEREPFAAMWIGWWGPHCYIDTVLDHDMLSFGTNYELAERAYRENHGRLWGLFPTIEQEADLSASFICRTLRGQPARFAKDTDPSAPLSTATRRFGLIYPNDYIYGAERKMVALAVKRAARAECGFGYDEIESYRGSGASGWAEDPPAILAKFKQRGITTVQCECTNMDITAFMNVATSLNYFPEWYWDNPMANPFYARLLADTKQTSFGIVPQWRQPERKKQEHYRAYLEEEPGTVPNSVWSFDIYQLFLNLFTAIQTAGPSLAPDSVRRGLFTVTYVNPRNPWLPSGGFGSYGPRATGDQTFVDTAMAWWFDPTGRYPDRPSDPGCARAMLGGRRFFPGGWPQSDAHLFDPRAPCYHGHSEAADTP